MADAVFGTPRPLTGLALSVEPLAGAAVAVAADGAVEDAVAAAGFALPNNEGFSEALAVLGVGAADDAAPPKRPPADFGVSEVAAVAGLPAREGKSPPLGAALAELPEAALPNRLEVPPAVVPEVPEAEAADAAGLA